KQFTRAFIHLSQSAGRRKSVCLAHVCIRVIRVRQIRLGRWIELLHPESETRKIRDSSLQENACPSANRHPCFQSRVQAGGRPPDVGGRERERPGARAEGSAQGSVCLARSLPSGHTTAAARPADG